MRDAFGVERPDLDGVAKAAYKDSNQTLSGPGKAAVTGGAGLTGAGGGLLHGGYKTVQRTKWAGQPQAHLANGVKLMPNPSHPDVAALRLGRQAVRGGAATTALGVGLGAAGLARGWQRKNR
jgi:hypothetical protein